MDLTTKPVALVEHRAGQAAGGDDRFGLVARVALAWWLGAAGVARRTAFHDLPIRRDTTRLCLVLLAYVVLLAATARRPAVRVAGTVAAVAASWQFAPVVGQAPIAVGFVMCSLGYAALVPRADGEGRADPAAASRSAPAVLRSPAPTAAAVTAAAAAVWARVPAYPVAVVAIVAAAATLAASELGVEQVRRTDRALRRAGTWIGTVAVPSAARLAGTLVGWSIRWCRLTGASIAGAATRFRTSEALPQFVAFAVGALASVPVFHRLVVDRTTTVMGYSDFPAHLAAARDLSFSPFTFPPHLLFHVASWLAASVAGWTWGPVIVASAGVGLTTLGVYRLGRRANAARPGLSVRWSLLLGAFVLLSESPTVLIVATGLASSSPNVASIHTWASPTDVVALGLGLVTLVQILDLLDRRGPSTKSQRNVLVISVVLAGLAKPSFTLPLIPALVGCAALAEHGDRRRWGEVARWVALPCFALLFGQFVVATNLMPAEQGNSGIELRPFHLVRQQHIGAGGLLFWGAGLLLPIAAWSAPRRYFRDPAVQLCGMGLGVAMGAMLLFAETGRRAGDGNLTRPAFFWWVLLFVASIRFAVGELAATASPVGGGRRTGLPPWTVALALYALVTAAAGAISFADAAGWTGAIPWSR